MSVLCPSTWHLRRSRLWLYQEISLSTLSFYAWLPLTRQNFKDPADWECYKSVCEDKQLCLRVDETLLHCTTFKEVQVFFNRRRCVNSDFSVQISWMDIHMFKKWRKENKRGNRTHTKTKKANKYIRAKHALLMSAMSGCIACISSRLFVSVKHPHFELPFMFWFKIRKKNMGSRPPHNQVDWAGVAETRKTLRTREPQQFAGN